MNPGFGHGHVNACDTGGPSSKHGIWFDDVLAANDAAERAGLEVTMLHAHIGSGPQWTELHENLTRLAAEFVAVMTADIPPPPPEAARNRAINSGQVAPA